MLITGASRGIGEALARRFAAAGAVVALVARSADAIEALAAELGGTAHPADLADGAQVATLVNRVEDVAGPVDVLVNNAGFLSAMALGDASPDDVERMVRVNLTTPIELCRQALPRMLRRGRGHVVNISSMAGCSVFPGLATYSATKSGLTHFTAGLRADLRGLPVRTTVVEIGPVPTSLLRGSEAYRPTAASFRRFRRLGLLVEVPPEKVADRVVDAVVKDHRHVRLPRRAATAPALAELPRRMTEVLLTGVRGQEKK
ncbi:MAG: SDR family oxidoreductase [Acidimicrobiia bacterium]